MKNLFKYLTNSRYWLYLQGLICNWHEIIIGSWHFLKIYRIKIIERTALIIEFNAFHGETLPGYAKYFQDLGYDVIVITRYNTYADSPFVRMSVKPKHFCLTIWGMRHFLKSPKIHDFDFILYNSACLFLREYRFFGRLNDFLGDKFIKAYKRFALIEHSLIPEKDLEYFQKLSEESLIKHILYYRSFVLTPQIINKHKIPMLNPCNFGTLNQKHNINKKRIFLTVGNVSSHSRDFVLLFSALKKLNSEYDFEVWIIGRILEKKILKIIPSFVKVLGRQSFDKMYNNLENADFFLPLLNPLKQYYYLNGCTSGSRQLILGFRIPPVIHKTFADHYGFTEDACFVYEDNNSFTDAIKKALIVTNEEYIYKKQIIDYIAKSVYKESIDNLRQLLNSTQPSHNNAAKLKITDS